MGFKRFEKTLGSGNIVRQMNVHTEDGTVEYSFLVQANSHQRLGLPIDHLSGDDLRALADDIDRLRDNGNLNPPKIFVAEID